MITMIEIYGRSVVFVGEVCIYGEYQSCQDRERTGRYRLITVFLQIRVNHITREIVPVGNQNETGGATENRAHRRKKKSLQKKKMKNSTMSQYVVALSYTEIRQIRRGDTKTVTRRERREVKFSVENALLQETRERIQWNNNARNSAFDFRFSRFSAKHKSTKIKESTNSFQDSSFLLPIVDRTFALCTD